MLHGQMHSETWRARRWHMLRTPFEPQLHGFHFVNRFVNVVIRELTVKTSWAFSWDMSTATSLSHSD